MNMKKLKKPFTTRSKPCNTALMLE